MLWMEEGGAVATRAPQGAEPKKETTLILGFQCVVFFFFFFVRLRPHTVEKTRAALLPHGTQHTAHASMRPAVLRHTLLLSPNPTATAALLARGLGLRLRGPQTERWAELDAGGGAVLAVTACEEEEKGGSGGGTAARPRLRSPFLCFAVGDVQATVGRLLEGGAELDGPIEYAPRGTVSVCVVMCGRCWFCRKNKQSPSFLPTPGRRRAHARRPRAVLV